MVDVVIACIALVAYGVGVRRIALVERGSKAVAAGDASSVRARVARILPFKCRVLVRSFAFVAALIFFAGYAAAGLVAHDPVSFTVLSIVLVACALGQLRSVRLVALIDQRLPRKVRWARPVVVLFVCTLLTFLALEVPSNHVIFSMDFASVCIELALIALFMVVGYFLFQRRAFGPVLITLAFLLLGIAEYFVITFKNMPIMPSDVLAAQTAAAVSSHYVFELSAYAIYGIAFGALACALAPLASTPAKRKTAALAPTLSKRKSGARYHRLRTVALNWGVALVMAVALYNGVFTIDYIQTLGVSVDAWQPLRAYYKQGFLPSFIVNMQNITQEEPDGYSDEYADELLAAYVEQYDQSEGASERYQAASAQFEEEQPSIIVVMNETFSDLSIFDELGVGYTGPENFQNINDALATGTLYVSAYGGSTCNTEFEFLTGASLGYMGAGVHPYQLYNLAGSESIARSLAELGYDTTAIHPNVGTNWNRDNVYEALGFDEFLTIDDFADAETYRGMVSDSATYETILEILESDDDPQFIFNVTMQNHSGYLTGELPEDMQTDYVDYSVKDEESIPETNEYLSLIDESDRALAELLVALQELDRPVVLIFFGDHQPYFTSDYNNALMSDEDEIDHTQRLWQTKYVIWANYDVAETDQTSTQDDTSANFLGVQALNLIGAPLTDYQKALVAIRQEMPAINLIGYQGANRQWYWHYESSAYEVGYTALRHIQYRMLFRNGTDPYATIQSTATNDVDPTEVIEIE